jgi:spore coat polysaccharide biosynthesis predicted glycosyltransferase SpsG
LASAQVAVLAAGSSLWEACAVETPSIGLIVADNQADSSAAAARLGFTHVIDCRNGLLAEDIVSAVRMVMKEKTEAMRDAARQCRVRDGVVQVARSLGALV